MLPIQLPPLNFQLSSSATSFMDQAGAQYGASNGAWNVNLAGSGVSLQSASAGLNWWLIAAAAGAAWYLFRR